MTEEIEKILQHSEQYMKEVWESKHAGDGNIFKAENSRWSKTKDKFLQNAQTHYITSIFLGVQALYEQNKAIIELLKNYKK